MRNAYFVYISVFKVFTKTRGTIEAVFGGPDHPSPKVTNLMPCCWLVIVGLQPLDPYPPCMASFLLVFFKKVSHTSCNKLCMLLSHIRFERFIWERLTIGLHKTKSVAGQGK